MNKHIANWDSLSDKEKEKAQELLKGEPGLNPAVVHPAAKFFQENGWVKIDKYIDDNMANLLYHHVQLETKRLSYFEENDERRASNRIPNDGIFYQILVCLQCT